MAKRDAASTPAVAPSRRRTPERATVLPARDAWDARWREVIVAAQFARDAHPGTPTAGVAVRDLGYVLADLADLHDAAVALIDTVRR